MLRKGRWDELWFVDLPDSREPTELHLGDVLGESGSPATTRLRAGIRMSDASSQRMKPKPDGVCKGSRVSPDAMPG